MTRSSVFDRPRVQGVKPLAQKLASAALAENPQSKPAVAPTPPSPPAIEEALVVIPTPLYWAALSGSLVLLLLALGFYSPSLNSYFPYLPYMGLLLLWTTIAISGITMAWSLTGLVRRGRFLERITTGTRRAATGMVEGFHDRQEASEGRASAWADRWSKRFALLGRLLVWVFFLPFRILVWLRYTVEAIVLQLMLVAYDVIYYPTYASWRVTYFAIRTSLRIVAWALWTAWRIIRFPTRLPLIRGWWRRKMRPRILANWKGWRDQIRRSFAQRMERGRRMADIRGEDPNRWEADYRRRRGFPLPHPGKGRKRIRKRLEELRKLKRERNERSQARQRQRSGTKPPAGRRPPPRLGSSREGKGPAKIPATTPEPRS